MNFRGVILVVLVPVVSLFSSCGGGGHKSPTPVVSSVSSSSVLASSSSSSSSSSSVLASSSSSSIAGLLGGAIQGKALNLTNSVTTFTHNELLANFYNVKACVVVGGNLFVTDATTIRKIVIATGEVTTLAGTAVETLTDYIASIDGTGAAASFHEPNGITTDGTDLFVSDTSNNTIRKIVIATGEVTTLAGTYVPGTRGGFSDGTGVAASFDMPTGITSDGTNLFVTDTYNSTIRKIVIATGVVTTFAGSASFYGSSSDGTGADASFDHPTGITTDGTNLFVTDSDANTIRKIVIATKVVTTLAGTAYTQGSNDGTGAASRFGNPTGIATDGTNLFVADTKHSTIRKIVIATGVVTTLAGTADGFLKPLGIAIDGANLFVADNGNQGTNVRDGEQYIRKIVIATGAVTTLAGDWYGSSDGKGAVGNLNFPAAGNLGYPYGITSDGTNLFVTNTGNNTISKIVIATGEVTSLAGTPYTQGSYNGTGFDHPTGITTDGTNLFVTDSGTSTIRQIVIATGEETTLAGALDQPGYNYSDGIGYTARFSAPTGITTDGTYLFVADTYNYIIRKIVIATGEVTTLAGTPRQPGNRNGTGADAGFNGPSGITTDGTNLFVTDVYSIRQIVIATGGVTTLAGAPRTTGSSDGTGADASFNMPNGITTDGTNLFVADSYNYTLRKIVIATGEVTTLAGTASEHGSDIGSDGTGADASFKKPIGITTDGTHLFVTDSDGYFRSRSDSIRKIE